MRYVWFVILILMLAGCAASGSLDKFKDTMLGKTDEPLVITYLSPAEEALVTEAALKKTTVNAPSGVASFEYEDKEYRVVSYAIKSGRSAAKIKAVVQNNKVLALSEQQTLKPLDPYAFTYAAEIVQNNASGSLGTIPSLYQGHAFMPQMLDECNVLVQEKDQDKVYFVYHFNVCKK